MQVSVCWARAAGPPEGVGVERAAAMDAAVVERPKKLLAAVVVVAIDHLALTLEAALEQPRHVVDLGAIFIVAAVARAAVGVDAEHVAAQRAVRRSEHEPLDMIFLRLGRIADLVACLTSKWNRSLINGEMLRVVCRRLPGLVEQALHLQQAERVEM
eukprot:6678474-Prymnesium_polylepis.1